MVVLPTIALFLLNACPPKEVIFPCSCNNKVGARVTCNELNAETSLESLLKPLREYSLTTLRFTNTNVSTLSTDVFKGLNVKQLMFYKFEVEDASFRPGNIHFQDLESSLELLDVTSSFRNGHSPLLNLRLDHLKNLKVAFFGGNHIPEVGNDWFTSGPVDLNALIFENNGIEELGDRAFRSLVHLESLSVAKNHLRDLTRSMFPETAQRLQTLDLKCNKIENIPSDLFSDMPSLTTLKLSDNLIRFLPEEAFSFLYVVGKKMTVRLIGNRLECDEKLKWVCKTGSFIDGACFKPTSQSGKLVATFCKE